MSWAWSDRWTVFPLESKVRTYTYTLTQNFGRDSFIVSGDHNDKFGRFRDFHGSKKGALKGKTMQKHRRTDTDRRVRTDR